mgnify:CR=1 FL=1
MEFNTKYYGSLKDFNFKDINKDNFNMLIKSGIFDESETSYVGKNYEDLAIEFGSYSGFCDFFLFNGKEYNLKREVVLEMIYVKNWMLEAFCKDDVESHILNDIEILVNGEFSTENKLKILEENYKKHFNLIEEKTLYSLYKNGTETLGYKSWEELINEEIYDSNQPEIVEAFLMGIDDYFPQKLVNKWKDYYIFSEISNYCENKKNLILNITPKIMDESENNSSKNIDLFYQISLLEEIINIKNWEDLSATRKGKIVKLMLGKDAGNIKDIYLMLNRPQSEMSDKHLHDRQKAIHDIKEILG